MSEKEAKGCLIERSGRYHAVISYYIGEHRFQETKTTGILVNAHKKREAEAIKNRLVQEKQKELERLAFKAKAHPFADCLERWVKYKSAQIESTTAWGYEVRSKTIIEYFRKKDMMIEDLQPKDILEYYEWALQSGRRNIYNENMPTGLSRRTVSDHAVLIRGFLNDAVVQGVINTNPADKVQVPRVQENKVEETAYMDTAQAKEFLAYIKTVPMFEKLYCFTKLGLCYGFRRSEILGLRWSAIDFEKGEIEIKHTVVRSRQGDEYRDNVKTKSSHRYLPLVKNVRGDLLELAEEQKKSGIYSKDGYVFKWEDGRPYSPDYITKTFKKAVLRCGRVPKGVTVHKLRHSCCAILTEQGWDLGKIHNWLGHSDISTTANIYNHVTKKWKNRHGELVDEIFG